MERFQGHKNPPPPPEPPKDRIYKNNRRIPVPPMSNKIYLGKPELDAVYKWLMSKPELNDTKIAVEFLTTLRI